MDLEKALQFAETYARGYLSYLLAFFGEPTPAAEGADAAADPFRTTVLFAILSCFLGAVFSTRAVSGLFPHQGDVLARMSEELAYWFALAFVLYLVLRVLGSPRVGLDVLLAVLTVTPVAYAMGGFGSYMAANIGVAFLVDPSPWLAYGAAVIIQIAVSAIYFPRYLARVPGLSRWRARAGSTVLIVTILIVQLIYVVVTYEKSRKEAAYRACVEAAQNSGLKPGAKGDYGCKR